MLDAKLKQQMFIRIGTAELTYNKVTAFYSNYIV